MAFKIDFRHALAIILVLAIAFQIMKHLQKTSGTKNIIPDNAIGDAFR